MESASPRCQVCQFSGKTDNFVFFDTNLPKSGFWARNFENLSPDSESSTSSYHVKRSIDKTDNLGELPNYVRFFGSYNVEDVAGSWEEAEMSWVEVGGARWRWEETDKAEWRWVHSLAIPNQKNVIVSS